MDKPHQSSLAGVNGAQISCMIALCAVVVFWPVTNQQFSNLDDGAYVFTNPSVMTGLKLENFWWACTATTEGTSYWHPLTWMSHIVDCQLFGLRAGYHKLTSLWLHVSNSVLLFLILSKFFNSKAVPVVSALLFALHPLHVESVAWISERKDLLSTLFCLLSFCLYRAYVLKPRVWSYTCALALYLCALMSKPMVVSFPLLLLLFDYWPFSRIKLEEAPKKSIFDQRLFMLVSEKLLFIAASGLVCYLTFIAQHRLGAVNFLHLSLGERVSNAFVVIVKYLFRATWPVSLCAFYPHPGQQPYGLLLFSLTGVVLLSYFSLTRARSYPGLFVAWFSYLICLLPVLGILQVGGQESADRYTYISLIGPFVWIAAFMFKHKKQQRFPALVATFSLILLSVLARRQVTYWRDGEALWRRVVFCYPNYVHGTQVLANMCFNNGRFEEARALFSANSSSDDWNDSRRLLMLARCDLVAWRLDRAQTLLREALKSPGTDKEALFYLGFCAQAKGDVRAAIRLFERADRISARPWRALCALSKIYWVFSQTSG